MSEEEQKLYHVLISEIRFNNYYLVHIIIIHGTVNHRVLSWNITIVAHRTETLHIHYTIMFLRPRRFLQQLSFTSWIAEVNRFKQILFKIQCHILYEVVSKQKLIHFGETSHFGVTNWARQNISDSLSCIIIEKIHCRQSHCS